MADHETGLLPMRSVPGWVKRVEFHCWPDGVWVLRFQLGQPDGETPLTQRGVREALLERLMPGWEVDGGIDVVRTTVVFRVRRVEADDVALTWPPQGVR